LKFKSSSGSVVDSSVGPNLGKADLYSGAMSITKEATLPGEVAIGELLAQLFVLQRFEIAGQNPPRPIVFMLPHPDKELADSDAPAPADTVMAMVEGLPACASRAELQAALDAYPSLEGGEPATYPTGIRVGPLTKEEDRSGVAYREPLFKSELFPVFRFPFDGTTVADYLKRYHELAPSPIDGEPLIRVAQPGVGAGRWMLGPVTPWWALLLGLSSLARYYPSQWRQALDIDREPIAPGLERVLDQAETSIPFFVFHALKASLDE
jgi:hypothetical protein